MILSEEQRQALLARKSQGGTGQRAPAASIHMDVPGMGDVAQALAMIAHAVASIPKADLSDIAGALAGMAGREDRDYGDDIASVTKSLAGLAVAFAGLSKAVAGISMDVSPVVAAVDRNTAALRDLADAYRAPRRIVSDDDGVPVSVEVDE